MIDRIGLFLLETFTPDWLKRRLARGRGLTPVQRWALAAGAQLTEMNDSRHDTLNPEPTADTSDWRSGLEQWWEVTGREELLDRLHWLESSGHRQKFKEALGHEPLAWDLVRYINLVRWGFGARFLQEAEAWQFILRVAPRLEAAYDSWGAMARDYILARNEWAGGVDPALVRVTERLLDPENKRSPWQQMPWPVSRALN
ncbi:DUF1266 domain-containing protein [Deinococcus hohokamensis]|uniref:DUF1266 domain-containing protein n=1 Tax=Deinococcus hohokamensis TaxID=309883 RepID=A0ABV9IEV8_9DEIO